MNATSLVPTDKEAWIGLHCMDCVGSRTDKYNWRWVRRDNTTFYDNWAINEPSWDNNERDCAVMLKNGQWEDRNCAESVF